MKLEDLPAYIYRPGSVDRFFLTVNRNITGRWSVGYLNFAENEVLFAMDDFNDLQAAALSLGVRLNDAQRH